ncbi:hypothetical protein [Actinomadura sp. KC345]|uniref:hypothetical protein n=1 Tax=Actinomadura sp. KC345 TaxID=2530371 RepID=UPI0014049CF2|nr:hypothetical protein [Actinomadura sp. KC345]
MGSGPLGVTATPSHAAAGAGIPESGVTWTFGAAAVPAAAACAPKLARGLPVCR